MRFDDMLATVLARQPDRLAARVAQWRQLLDLVAQSRLGDDVARGRDALDRLGALRPDVPVTIRRESAAAVAGRPVPALLVAFLAADVPQVSGEILGRVHLADEDWLTIMPHLSPTGRGFLRHRRDLSTIVQASLSGFGSTDLSLGSTVAADAAIPPAPVALVTPNEIEAGVDPVPVFEPGAGEGQIRAIISRIARFRTGRPGLAAPIGEPGATTEQDGSLFHFETGTDGVIRWLEGVPRGPLIGETIAVPAASGCGVDAQAPGAFRRRAAFRDARLVVAGRGPAAGEWRIAGVPIFAPQDGRFLGYRGTGRRPRRDERAEFADPHPVGGPVTGPATGGLPSDSLRQLVHELRTPLNAIGGFAEMIRRQMRGPVSGAYRDRAQRIAEQASQLLAAVDDLDVAARLDSARLDLQHLPVDVALLLKAVCADHADLARGRGAEIVCTIADDAPRAIGDAAAMRRMIARLVASATALAYVGEAIHLTLERAPSAPMLLLSVTRPAQLAGVAEADLLDPGYGPEGDWPDAPLLGLGFSLHLVRRLALAAGGALMIDDACFTLRLPIDRGSPDPFLRP